MPYILGGRVVEDHGLYVEEHGQGEPLVLICGLARSMRHWLGFEKLLAQHFRVITIDNRGIGRSSGLPMTHRHSIADLAGDVVSVLDALGVDRAHIVGLSLGGMVSMALGFNHPGRVRTLTIINSSIAGTLKTRLSVLATVRLALEGLDLRRRQKVLADYLLTQVSKTERNRIVELWQEFDAQEPLVVANVLAQFWAAFRFHVDEKLARISAPTMVLGASHDAFVPLRNSKVIHDAIPHSIFRVIEGGGHEVVVDMPDAVCDAILSFIEHRELHDPHVMDGDMMLEAAAQESQAG